MFMYCYVFCTLFPFCQLGSREAGADAASGEASFWKNKSISLSRLKGVLKDTGIASDKVEVRFIEPGKQAKLSQKIVHPTKAYLVS